MADTSWLKVYYDAACPLCRRERQRYERWAQRANSVEWLDANTHEAVLQEHGVTVQEALLSLHVEDADGQLYRGMPAYSLLMKRVPLMRPLAVLISLPVIKPALTWWYDRWVRRRLSRQGRL
ncbi:DUF393 domain-containing protein [Halomonas sp. 18H]|uniref:thiol-disulfide oxidoreductase DCC family protein n=1 Tax=Halomonas almeriensis TaxID=308163 RepID=UPI0022314621|nr:MULTISPECIES: DUF393 domain-containing protein [Halomonas]MCW4151499.1 DUF393 domain-containing protein [Halomonas sp. 18H]MDN3552641.1 DUF393 domain-containing protein [Halomonas almeriensis]